MNEIELFEKIQNSIHEGTYNELLNDSEKALLVFLSRYVVEDILILINRIILFHNYNMMCKEYDYSKYRRDKHLSLRLLLALPRYYCANVLDTEKIHIKDFDMVMEELINKIIQLQSVYYYYPYRNEKNVIFDDDSFFYMNYFKSYYFDFPCMEIYEYLSFFNDNIELCKNVLADEKFNESLNLMCYLQNIENNMKNENLWFKMKCGKAIRKSIKINNVYILCSTKLIQKICRQNKIDYENIIKNYAYQIGTHNEDYVKMIDVIADREDKRFLMMTTDFLYFPRNYYWMHQWYNKIWRSHNISQKLTNGKTIKSQMHEDELYELLKQYFGEINVYANAYLRRTGRQYAEKDFIVLYKNVVLSFEAKSNLLPTPELEVTDRIDNLKRKCEECIKKAYDQSLEVKQSIASGKAVFYDSPNKKNKVLLDLRDFKIEKCIQVVVMYEEYLGIETNIERICPEFDAWIIDIKNLMYILADTVGRGDFDTFVDYALKRKNVYGLIDVQSGEELKVYNLYKNLPVFFERDCKGRGITIHI